MSYGFPVIIEGLVAALLMITIVYCVRLNRGIKQLKGQEKTLKSTIAELITVTDTAERAIAGLKATVRDADQTLGERLRASEKFAVEIGRQLESGESILNRLSQIASLRPALAQASGGTSGRTSTAPSTPAPAREPKPVMPDTKKIMAAAQAFAQRARNRLQSRAA